MKKVETVEVDFVEEGVDSVEEEVDSVEIEDGDVADMAGMTGCTFSLVISTLS